MTGTAIILLGSVTFLLLLLFGQWYWRKKYRQSLFSLDSSGKRGPWWYQNRYTPNLPLANPHSGIPVQPKIFATEHLRTPVAESAHTLDKAFPYKRRAKFFSPTEQALLQALGKVLQPYPYRVLSKIYLTEILDLATELPPAEQRVALERLRRKRLDFVVCHIDTAEIVGVITLDEVSEHERLDSQLQERFVDLALSAVGIPSIHIAARLDYPVSALQQTLQTSLKLSLSTAKISATIGTCPKCGQPLRRVKITKGKFAGRQLRACSDYPRCKTLLPETSSHI